MDWSKHTAVLAAIVAAVGLGFTAWGTAKSAQVADDQLAQSRDAQQQEEKAQASAVTMWEEWKFSTGGAISGEDWSLVIANRSLDPVQVGLLGPAERQSDNKGLAKKDHVVYLGPLPPCTRASYTTGSLIRATSIGLTSFSVQEMIFLDASGGTWQRKRDGLLAKLGGEQAFKRRVLAQNTVPLSFAPIRKAKLQRLDPCMSS